MKFVIAPAWFMKLSDNTLLKVGEVLSLYGYAEHGSTTPSVYISKGSIPPADVLKGNGLIKKRYFWSVGYLKNHLKLPSEINQDYVIKTK